MDLRCMSSNPASNLIYQALDFANVSVFINSKWERYEYLCLISVMYLFIFHS